MQPNGWRYLRVGGSDDSAGCIGNWWTRQSLGPGSVWRQTAAGYQVVEVKRMGQVSRLYLEYSDHSDLAATGAEARKLVPMAYIPPSTRCARWRR